MSEAPRVFVGLGANLGDAAAQVRGALVQLAALPATRVVAASSLYRSEPVGAQGPDYVNAVAELRTTLEPAALLAQLQALELRFGRERTYRNAPRTLDLDLLVFGDHCIATPTLTLPHPRMHERAFVLAPLAELAPTWCLADGRTVAAALAAVSNQRLERMAR